MIQKINYFITKLFDFILYPFSFLNDFWGILFLSIFVSLVVLVIYRYISSPDMIKDAKNKIKANILAIRLYKDFWRVILTSFVKSLFYIFKYFTLNFIPLLVIIPILSPVFSQMDIRYGKRAFKSGDEIIIKTLFTGNPYDMKITLLENENFSPKMNPVFINAYRDDEKKVPIREVNWKTEAIQDGKTNIRIKVNGKIFDKSLVIGNFRGALSDRKFSDSSIQHFLYPAEKLLLPGKELEAIYIKYPGKNISILGIEIHWIILHLIIVVAIVLGFSKKFGIVF